MNDLISRQAVIDAIENTDWYHQNDNGDMVSGANPDMHQAWYKAEDIYKALESVPSAQPEPRWIPCSERLPEEGVNVLLCIKDWESQKTKIVVSLRRDYNYWDGLGRDIRGDITWMPLPEPYKADEEV